MELGEGMEHVEPMHIDYGCVDTQLCPENRKKSLVIGTTPFVPNIKLVEELF